MTLIWVAVYGLLEIVASTMGFGGLSRQAVLYECAAAGTLLFSSACLHRSGRWACLGLSLALSRVLHLALEFLGTRHIAALAPYFTFRIRPLELTTWELAGYPALAGLGACAALALWGGRRLVPYRGLEFVADAQSLARKKPGFFILGKTPRKLCLVPRSARQTHLQVIGPTGSGKTQLVLGLVYQDMLRGMPVFLMEAKGDRGDFETFLDLASRAGRAGDVVYFNPAEPASMSYNPLQEIGPAKDPVTLTNQLARAIGREPGGTSDGEHYRSLDFSRLLDLSRVFLCAGRDLTLAGVLAYFTSREHREALFADCPEKSLVEAARAGLEPREGDLSALIAHLKPWTVGNLGKILNDSKPAITLESVFEQRKLAYFAIPAGYMPLQTNALGRMLISNLLGYAQSRHARRVREPASLYLEEFPEFVTPAFSTLISTVRSANLWVCLSHQDLGQLKRIEGMDKEAFVANVLANTGGAKVFFKMVSPEDAERVAAMMGTHKARVRTRQIRRGLLGYWGTGLGTEADKEVFNIHPNELKAARPFRAAVLADGRKPAAISTPMLFEVAQNQVQNQGGEG